MVQMVFVITDQQCLCLLQ